MNNTIQQPSISSRVLARLAGACLLSALFLVFLVRSEATATIYSIPLAVNFFAFTSIALCYITNTSRLLSPIGVLCVFLIYFIAIAPALHLQGDFWLYLGWTDGQPPWVGLWALIQGFGFLAALSFYYLIYAKTDSQRAKNTFQLRRGIGRFLIILLCVSLLFRVLQFVSDGGIRGLLSGYALRLEGDYSAVEGRGALLVLADMSQVIICITIIYFFRRRKLAQSDLFLIAFLGLVGAYTMLFSGLKGSRGPTLIAIFYALALYHYSVRPVRFKFIAICGALTVLYIAFGSWYKFGGLTALYDSSARQDALQARQIGNETMFVALRDFSRADIQSLAVKKVAEGEFSPVHGRSYVGALTYLFPRSVLPSKPETFAKEKTELRYGPGNYTRDQYTRLVAGQYAEMIMNFGLVLGTISFFLLVYWYIVRFSGLFNSLASYPPDAIGISHFAAPLLLIAPVLVITTDSNVLLLQAAKYLVPVGLLHLLSRLK